MTSYYPEYYEDREKKLLEDKNQNDLQAFLADRILIGNPDMECSIVSSVLHENVHKFLEEQQPTRYVDGLLVQHPPSESTKRYAVYAECQTEMPHLADDEKVREVARAIRASGFQLSFAFVREVTEKQTRQKSLLGIIGIKAPSENDVTHAPVGAPMLVLIGGKDNLMLPITTFDRRADGGCEFIQLGSEITDQYGTVLDDGTPRAKIISNISDIFKDASKGYGELGYKTVPDLVMFTLQELARYKGVMEQTIEIQQNKEAARQAEQKAREQAELDRREQKRIKETEKQKARLFANVERVYRVGRKEQKELLIPADDLDDSTFRRVIYVTISPDTINHHSGVRNKLVLIRNNDVGYELCMLHSGNVATELLQFSDDDWDDMDTHQKTRLIKYFELLDKVSRGNILAGSVSFAQHVKRAVTQGNYAVGGLLSLLSHQTLESFRYRTDVVKICEQLYDLEDGKLETTETLALQKGKIEGVKTDIKIDTRQRQDGTWVVEMYAFLPGQPKNTENTKPYLELTVDPLFRTPNDDVVQYPWLFDIIKKANC